MAEREIKLRNRSFFCLQGSSVLTFDNKHWPATDSEAGFIVVENSKSFVENKDILAGILPYGSLNLRE